MQHREYYYDFFQRNWSKGKRAPDRAVSRVQESRKQDLVSGTNYVTEMLIQEQQDKAKKNK